MELKSLLPKEQLLSSNLLNNNPKNPPDWINLKIWVLESFKSVEILLLNAFLSSIFVLLSVTIHEADHFHQAFFKLILKVVPVLFLTALSSFLNCVAVDFTLNLQYSAIYTNYRTFA